MTTARPGRKPFYVHIATLFILLFTLLGSALIALQFQQGARQDWSTSDRTSCSIASSWPSPCS